MSEARRAWRESIEELLKKNVSEMGVDDLNKLVLAYRDEEELERWEDEGDDVFDQKSEEYEEKYGLAFPIYANAPQVVKEAYKRLGEIEKRSAEEGVILN